MIKFSEKKNLFLLDSDNSSYIIHLFKKRHLLHLYWGRPLVIKSPEPYFEYEARPTFIHGDPKDKSYYPEELPFEYGFLGWGDFRAPSFTARTDQGELIPQPVYQSHKIFGGKPGIPGLPATWSKDENEAQTLKILLRDTVSGLTLSLFYTLFPGYDIITRHALIENRGKGVIYLEKAMSSTVDFLSGKFDLLTLPGAWGRERHLERRPLGHGTTAVGSCRGISSHQFNPFYALLAPGTSEHHGEVYGFNLVYSGNFLGEVERDQDNRTRASLGINPWGFRWRLAAGESFITPEAVLVFSSQGLNGMSRIYHDFYRQRLSRSSFALKERPILVNNWEATYFSFTEADLLKIARKGRDLGIELFVLDDGWFGERNSDNCCLGDWQVNREKLPGGIQGLAGKVRQLGMGFGLWFEPEMVSPHSDLFRAHPDWCLHLKGRVPVQGRNQLVLDLCRQEVRDEIVRMLKEILKTGAVNYVKWDMNRSLTDLFSASLPADRQGELSHRYVLGLYSIMEEITASFPAILFEGCASGGGRFDPGILYYMPQFWTSDNTDAVSRLKIQYGTSLVYPPLFMGAHVSAVPNHQVGRITDITMRGDVAMMGNLGYELDLGALTPEDEEKIREQTAFYKSHRALIQFGRFYRLISPFETNSAAWLIVNQQQNEFILYYYQILGEANSPRSQIRLKGLEETAVYRDTAADRRYSGSELMHRGLPLPRLFGDFRSWVRYFLRE